MLYAIPLIVLVFITTSLDVNLKILLCKSSYIEEKILMSLPHSITVLEK